MCIQIGIKDYLSDEINVFLQNMVCPFGLGSTHLPPQKKLYVKNLKI